MTKPVPGAVRGRPAMPAEERRRRVLLTVSPEVDLGLSVLAEARGTSRSGVVEALVREAWKLVGEDGDR